MNSVSSRSGTITPDLEIIIATPGTKLLSIFASSHHGASSRHGTITPDLEIITIPGTKFLSISASSRPEATLSSIPKKKRQTKVVTTKQRERNSKGLFMTNTQATNPTAITKPKVCRASSLYACIPVLSESDQTLYTSRKCVAIKPRPGIVTQVVTTHVTAPSISISPFVARSADYRYFNFLWGIIEIRPKSGKLELPVSFVSNMDKSINNFLNWSNLKTEVFSEIHNCNTDIGNYDIQIQFVKLKTEKETKIFQDFIQYALSLFLLRPRPTKSNV